MLLDNKSLYMSPQPNRYKRVLRAIIGKDMFTQLAEKNKIAVEFDWNGFLAFEGLIECYNDHLSFNLKKPHGAYTSCVDRDNK